MLESTVHITRAIKKETNQKSRRSIEKKMKLKVKPKNRVVESEDSPQEDDDVDASSLSDKKKLGNRIVLHRVDESDSDSDMTLIP